MPHSHLRHYSMLLLLRSSSGLQAGTSQHKDSQTANTHPTSLHVCVQGVPVTASSPVPMGPASCARVLLPQVSMGGSGCACECECTQSQLAAIRSHVVKVKSYLVKVKSTP